MKRLFYRIFLFSGSVSTFSALCGGGGDKNFAEHESWLGLSPRGYCKW